MIPSEVSVSRVWDVDPVIPSRLIIPPFSTPAISIPDGAVIVPLFIPIRLLNEATIAGSTVPVLFIVQDRAATDEFIAATIPPSSTVHKLI